MVLQKLLWTNFFITTKILIAHTEGNTGNVLDHFWPMDSFWVLKIMSRTTGTYRHKTKSWKSINLCSQVATKVNYTVLYGSQPLLYYDDDCSWEHFFKDENFFSIWFHSYFKVLRTSHGYSRLFISLIHHF